MLEQIEGSAAIAKAVARCRPEVVAAYPISPQTHIVEGLSDLVRTGELSPCEYLMVESEFGALSACIGASGAGARSYTATSSQGLLFMSCGNCFGCDNCYGVCPDNAVIKLGRPGEKYLIDLDYCKGCGLCVSECPAGAIQMFPEEI